MSRRPVLLIALAFAALATGAPRAQTPGAAAAPPPPDGIYHAVAYVEVAPPSAGAAVTALARYRDGSRAQDGYVKVDVFEQAGRRGRFAVVEAWRDQAAFDAHAAASQKVLLTALDPIRISGYDQRPYKTLTTAPARGDGKGQVAIVSHVDVSMDPRVPGMLRGLADASRREAGSVRFDIVQHAMRANHFTVVEVWRDEAAFDAHVTAAHTKQYRNEIQPFTGSPLDERLYRPLD